MTYLSTVHSAPEFRPYGPAVPRSKSRAVASDIAAQADLELAAARKHVCFLLEMVKGLNVEVIDPKRLESAQKFAGWRE